MEFLFAVTRKVFGVEETFPRQLTRNEEPVMSLKQKISPMTSPWRRTAKSGDIEWDEKTEKNLRMQCWDIVPLEKKNKINIILLGNTGSGKSSYLNSLQSALADRIVHRAHVERSCNTVTSVLNAISNVGDTETNFKFIDIPGLMESDSDIFYAKFLDLAMEGRIKENTPLTTEYTKPVDLAQGGKTPSSSTAEAAQESTKDAIRIGAGHIDINNSKCVTAEGDETLIPSMVVIVLRANRPTNEKGLLRKRIERICQSAGGNRMNIAVVLTAADETSQDEEYPVKQTNAKYIFRSPAVKNAVEAASVFTGVPANLIFPVTNYTGETEVSTEMNILHLYTLRSILYAAVDGYMNRQSSADVMAKNVSE